MPRNTGLARNMMRYIVPALLLVFLIPVLRSFFQTQPQTLQPHEPTSPTFGIGLDLGASYGTVAVSYPNGTIQSIAKVEGDAAYLEVMSRLSLHTSIHPHQPYQYGEGVVDWPRRTLRDIRIWLGLPASRDVGILSKMIKKLHIAAESFIGVPVPAAKAAIPDFACALYSEDIYEAFDYLQLSYQQFRPWNYWKPMYSSDGAYAASDYRICSNYTEPDLCWKSPPHSPSDPPWEPIILIISYTYAYLEARETYGIYPIIASPGHYNSTLGYNSLQDAPSEEAYWEEVRQFIRGSNSPSPRNVTQLLITGDAAHIPKFREVLKEVTDSMFEEELEVLDEHPVFAGARGVAIFVMRAIWRQNHGDGNANIVQEL